MNYRITAMTLLLLAYHVNAIPWGPDGNSNHADHEPFWKHPVTWAVAIGSASIIGLVYYIYQSDKKSRREKMEQYCSPASFQEERSIAQKMLLNDQTFVPQLINQIQSYGANNGFPYVTYESMLNANHAKATALLKEFEGTAFSPVQGTMQHCRSLSEDLNRIRVYVRQQPAYQTELREYQKEEMRNKQFDELRRHNATLEQEIRSLNQRIVHLQNATPQATSHS
jgi:hypothetical protein